MTLSRRQFLTLAGLSTGAALGAGGIIRSDHRSSSTDAALDAFDLPSGGRIVVPPDERLLVVIEMAGGNDGLSMVVPYGDGHYYDLRTATAIAADELHHLDDVFGLHPRLTSISAADPAVVLGVGDHRPDLSHFEMLRRWWVGEPGGGHRMDAGFLGRLADAVGSPDSPLVALTVGSGSHLMTAARRVSTASLDSLAAVSALAGADPDDEVRSAFQFGWAAMGSRSGPDLDGGLRAAMAQAQTLAEELTARTDLASPDGDDGYPSTPLGTGLRTAADLLGAGLGLRIVHVPMGADFDTHDDHPGRFDELMGELDQAVGAFLADLGQRGLRHRVLIATISEFGRRAGDNGSNGLDHGTASSMLLLGPVIPGLHGEAPSLRALDEDGNLIATVGFDEYYAMMAEDWFGVPAGEVLDGAPRPLGGVITA